MSPRENGAQKVIQQAKEQMFPQMGLKNLSSMALHQRLEKMYTDSGILANRRSPT
jgi:hypothetical protein